MGFPVETKRDINYALLLEMYEELKKEVENAQSWEDLGRAADYWVKWYDKKKM